MNAKVLIALILIVTTYLVLGGVIFHFIEYSPEQDTQFGASNFTETFLAQHPCITREEMQKLLQTVLTAYDKGILPNLSNTSSSNSNWDIASSIFFATTVITTIGYGNIAPTTTGGRAFCVIYALVGIPLCLVMLSGVGANLRDVTLKLNDKLNVCRRHPKAGRVVRVAFLVSLGLLVFVIVPAIVFMTVDNWTYAESIYCVFITLTTVGFGDFVPGSSSGGDLRPMYRLFTGVFIMLGLAWLATIISTFQNWLTGLANKTEDKIETLHKYHKKELPEDVAVQVTVLSSKKMDGAET